MKIRVFEAFAGYGSQAMALNRLRENYPEFDYEVVGISEIDKYALQAYQAVHGHCPNYGDISKVDWNTVPDFDLLTYSFPCTDISNAGQQKGLSKASGTRSSLLWECQRAIEIKRPKYLLMENVSALLSQKFLPDFKEWRNILGELGYSSFTQILDATQFGVPQHRERVFMVSILGDCQYHFPTPFKLAKRLKDVLEPVVDEKYYLSDKMLDYFNRVDADSTHSHNFTPKGGGDIAFTIRTLQGNRVDDNFIIDETDKDTDIGGGGNTDCYIAEPRVMQVGNIVDDSNIGFKNPQRGRVYNINGISPCLYCFEGGGLEPKVLQLSRGFNKGGVKKNAPTITSSSFEHNNFCIEPLLIPEATTKGYAEAYDGDSVNLALPNSKTRRGRVGHQQANTLDTSCNQGVVTNYRIRKLTPRECFRLMDVSEPDIDKLLNAGISNSQLYKLAGNSIVVACLYHIFRKMFIETQNENQQLTLF